MNDSFPKRVQAMKQRFSVLDSWRIYPTRIGGLRCQCQCVPEEKRAWICFWEESTPEPADYVLHEVLHVALRAITAMDKRKRKEQRKAEESLVFDVCRLLLCRSINDKLDRLIEKMPPQAGGEG